MTTYNAGRLLQEAVESVVKQSFSDWELVVVDNASTDASTDNLEFTDARIRYIKLEANVGRTSALNIGLFACVGEYVAILDADDLCHPSRLGVQSQFLDPNIGHSLIGSEYETIDEGGRRIKMHRCAASPNEVEKSLGYTNVIAHSTVMYRRLLALESGGYDESFPYAQDFEMTLKLMKLGKIEILHECLSSIRIHQNSETNKNQLTKTRLLDEYRCFRIANSHVKVKGLLTRKQGQRLAVTAIAMAYSELKTGNIRKGIAYLIEGINHDRSFSWVITVVKYFRNSNARS
jgi:glycosyltransferase involved in cell wall biosynthesis